MTSLPPVSFDFVPLKKQKGAHRNLGFICSETNLKNCNPLKENPNIFKPGPIFFLYTWFYE